MKRTVPKSIVVLTNGVWNWLDRHSASLALALATVTIGSAFVGIAIDNSPEDWKPEFSMRWIAGSLYQATQAILMDLDPDDEETNRIAVHVIAVARIAAVLFVLLVTTKAIGQLFKHSSKQFQLFIRGKRNVLVCGLNQIGLQVTLELAKKGEFVVANELDADKLSIELAEKAGAIVIHGDVADIDTLREQIYQHPRLIYLVTGDDHANLAALVNILKLREEYRVTKKRSLSPAECLIHIADPDLVKSISRLVSQSASGKIVAEKSFEVRVFNIHHEVARELILNELTPLRPRSRDDVALYIVFGFGQMAQSMVKQLVELAHFENQKRSRILVLTDQAETHCDQLLSKWGKISPRFVHQSIDQVQFDSRCDEWDSQAARPADSHHHVPYESATEYAANIHFCQFSNHSLSSSAVDRIVDLAGAANVCPVVLFCADQDNTNFRLANELNHCLQDFYDINVSISSDSANSNSTTHQPARDRGLQLPLFVFLPENKPLWQILEYSSKERFNLMPFGAVGEGMRRVHDDLIQNLAIEINWAYISSTEDKQKLPSRQQHLQDWSSKDHWERSSNLLAAEHALIKLQILKSLRTAEESQDATDWDHSEPTIEEYSLLALIEHNRWMAERLLMGWSYGPEHKEKPPTRESICVWTSVPAEELEKDISQVQAVVQFLKRDSQDRE